MLNGKNKWKGDGVLLAVVIAALVGFAAAVPHSKRVAKQEDVEVAIAQSRRVAKEEKAAVAIHKAKKVATDVKTEDPHMATAIAALKAVPLIDGHNDLAYAMYKNIRGQLADIDLTQNLTNMWSGTPHSDVENLPQTDIPRLEAGTVGGLFWVAYADCARQYKDAVPHYIAQIDLIKRMVAQYDIFQWTTTAQGIEDAFTVNKIASMLGVEGGHAIDSSLARLRMLYELGARYLTLTHNCNTPWVDSCLVDDPKDPIPGVGGLSEFGKVVIREMNRLGMMVDLSHVSAQAMRVAINTSAAPVIFSHSSAKALCDHIRNVPDDVLHMVTANGGIVMANFWDEVNSCYRNNVTEADLTDVADHIDYIRNTAGLDHVGLGSDYDGAPMPNGLKDVSKYPNLLAELARRGWTQPELEQLTGENFLRVFRKVEEVRDEQLALPPYEEWIDESVLVGDCRTPYPEEWIP